MGNASFKILVVLISVTFYNEPLGTLCAVLALSAAFGVWIYVHRPCFVEWLNLGRELGLLIIIEFCIFAILFDQTKSDETIFTVGFLVLALVEVCTYFIYIYNKFDRLFYRDESERVESARKTSSLLDIDVSAKGSICMYVLLWLPKVTEFKYLNTKQPFFILFLETEPKKYLSL